MSAESENIRDTFADQLASFDNKLHATADDVELLAGIQAGIGDLLASSGGSERQIRQVLQERYDNGSLRKETFQLVKSMLDRYVTESIPTAPTRSATSAPKPPVVEAVTPIEEAIVEESSNDDAFGSTTVIPVGIVNDKKSETRVQVGSVLRDRFLLQEKIAGGSMGVVYKALDRRLAEAGSKEHWVAVKVLSPELAENGNALRALQQEAAKGRCLVHPNIVRFIDLDRDDDLYFLVLEWMDGRTLADILDSKDADTIDRETAFRIVRQIGDALDYAHRCGIVHADVKPGNIMILPNGDAKLFDFGVARVRQQHADTEFDPGVLGAVTPAYSSMQVLTGEEPVAADDVFSLSCLLYRLIAGYRVFGPRNAAEASQEGMTPQPVKGLNDSQWKALKKGLSYARVMRFASVREFIAALDVHSDEPFRVEAADRPDANEEPGNHNWIPLALLLIAVIAAAIGYASGYLDPMISRLTGAVERKPVIETAVAPIAERPEAASIENKSERVAEEQTEQTAVKVEPGLITEPFAVEDELVGPDPMLVDFSKLPPPTKIVEFSRGARTGNPVPLTIREDSGEVIVDFVRDEDIATPLTLRLDEVGFSGNRSPWASGQFALSNGGMIHFPPGQTRGRITLTMASDPLREADQQSTLRLREAEFADTELAIINLTLEDDDQRVFESGLPTNTVAFVASQASIRESDPAVQIDLVRFNPDDSPLQVEIVVSDITATEGSDYFAPGGQTVSFGPGQRSARILVPLVQDAEIEPDEAFVVELVDQTVSIATDVYRRIVVMIRDDDPQTR
ncbi:MAG TPA: protein kinase [Woeseiaceae bacterium]|nr:protein kinase [Woeseiaceae bacterium]